MQAMQLATHQWPVQSLWGAYKFQMSVQPVAVSWPETL